MAHLQLTLGNLKFIDMGKIDAALDMHVRRAIRDCLDRPGDEHARKVTLTFEIVPQTDQQGGCDHVLIGADVHSIVPKHKTRVYQCRPNKDGEVFFNELDCELFEQGTLDEEAERNTRKGDE